MHFARCCRAPLKVASEKILARSVLCRREEWLPVIRRSYSRGRERNILENILEKTGSSFSSSLVAVVKTRVKIPRGQMKTDKDNPVTSVIFACSRFRHHFYYYYSYYFFLLFNRLDAARQSCCNSRLTKL